MKVPFVNLNVQHQDDMERILQAIAHVFETDDFGLGSSVDLFERAIAKMLGVPHAVGVNSGTDALLLTLKALGIGQGASAVRATVARGARRGSAEDGKYVGSSRPSDIADHGGGGVLPGSAGSMITSDARGIVPGSESRRHEHAGAVGPSRTVDITDPGAPGARCAGSRR